MLCIKVNSWSSADPEDEGITVYWNGGNYSPDKTLSHPRRLEFSVIELWEFEILHKNFHAYMFWPLILHLLYEIWSALCDRASGLYLGGVWVWILATFVIIEGFIIFLTPTKPMPW